MNKKTAVKKLRIILNEVMKSELRTFDASGKDLEKVALEKGFCEGWLQANKQLEKALKIFETKYIKLKK